MYVADRILLLYFLISALPQPLQDRTTVPEYLS